MRTLTFIVITDIPLLDKCNDGDNQMQNDDSRCLDKIIEESSVTPSTTYEDKYVQTDNDTDSAFEEDSFYSADEESPRGVNEGLFKQLQDLIIYNDDKKFDHLCRDLDKNVLEKLNNRGFNCLHLSAKSGNLKIVLKLLEFKVDIELLTSDKRNALHIAAFYGSFPICKHILKNCKRLFDVKDRHNMNAAHWAALNGQEAISKLMLQSECNLSETTPKY